MCRESGLTSLVASTPFIIAITAEDAAACLADDQGDKRPGFPWDGRMTYTSLPSCFCRTKTLGLHVGRVLEILQFLLISPSEWQWFSQLFTASSKQPAHSSGLQKPLFLCSPTTHLVLCQKLEVVWRTIGRMTRGLENMVGRLS